MFKIKHIRRFELQLSKKYVNRFYSISRQKDILRQNLKFRAIKHTNL